jgi:hypothetical protein
MTGGIPFQAHPLHRCSKVVAAQASHAGRKWHFYLPRGNRNGLSPDSFSSTAFCQPRPERETALTPTLPRTRHFFYRIGPFS